MRLVHKLYLVVLVGAALYNRPHSEDVRHKVLLVAVGVDAFLVLLFELGGEFEGLLDDVFAGELGAAVFLVFVDALVVGFFIPIVPFL